MKNEFYEQLSSKEKEIYNVGFLAGKIAGKNEAFDRIQEILKGVT
jgi:hypothetical protein